MRIIALLLFALTEVVWALRTCVMVAAAAVTSAFRLGVDDDLAFRLQLASQFHVANDTH